jgi:hypothetical protein
MIDPASPPLSKHPQQPGHQADSVLAVALATALLVVWISIQSTYDYPSRRSGGSIRPGSRTRARPCSSGW